ncbi:MAG: 3-dehydroquinate synthase [Vicinamibacterales bacterium]
MQADSIDQHFTVPFRYRVYFTRDVFARSNPLLANATANTIPGQPSRVLFVVDEGVSRAHPALIRNIEEYCNAHATALSLAGPVLVVAGGEQAKNDPNTAETILQSIHGASLCRHSYVAAIGGGAVLDVAGYAAATVHRGVRLIRLPTTVLAQDDSGIGVKNGINAHGQKNYLGTFAPPFAVINDFSFLTTLSDRDWRGGVAEAVKAALIKDARFFDFIEAHAPALLTRDMPTMEAVIRRCAELHLEHIARGGDPFEMGSSRPLDFGHWAAHKLEGLSGHRLRHGQAVSIGIALDTTYSQLAGWLTEADWRRIISLLQDLQLPVFTAELAQHLDDDAHAVCVLRGLDEFREHLGGQLTVMLLKGIGAPFDAHEIQRDLVVRSIDKLKSLQDQRPLHEEPHEHPIAVERKNPR